MSELAPRNFNARRELEDIYERYPLVAQYFCDEGLDLVDEIYSLCDKLNMNSEDIPLSTIELLEV